MKIKDIELANISRYRGELMGAAILFVILFHVGLPREDAFFGLKRMGNIGVDFFLFLSGMGLWFAWTKNPSLRQFYLRRFLRIYPTWFLIACLYYIPDYLKLELTGHRGQSTNIIDLIGDITINWNFWLHDELTFWYIPAIMFFYLVSPFYMRLIIKHPTYRWLPVLMIMWCIIVQYVTPTHEVVGHLEIFWSRVPIFFLGINIAAAVKRKETIEGSSIWMIGITFVMTLASCIFLEQVKHGQFPLFLERMLYIPLTITAIILLTYVFSYMPKHINKTLTLFGTLSLELYLIHAHFVLDYLERNNWAYWPTFFVATAITLPLAWLLHTAIEQIITPIEKRIK
jgi:putative acyltransferase